MLRKACSIGLIGLVGLGIFVAPASADPVARAARPTKAAATSGSKRVLWTVVGIGAGFGAGLLIGLNAFDDAIDSDRKVWTSALVGAAAGGLTGNLVGKNIGRVPAVRVNRRTDAGDVRGISWPVPGAIGDESLRRLVRGRVRAVTVPAPAER